MTRRTPELTLVHSLLDSWRGIGLIVVGMLRQGFDVSLVSYPQGWRASFLHRSHTPTSRGSGKWSRGGLRLGVGGMVGIGRTAMNDCHQKKSGSNLLKPIFLKGLSLKLHRAFITGSYLPVSNLLNFNTEEVQR